MGPDPPLEGASLRGQRESHCKVYGHYAVIYAKMSEPIEMSFGLWAPMGPSNNVLDGAQIPHGKGTFGERASIVKYRTLCGHLCEKG